ncbi:lipoprotein YedD [Kosakonia sp. H02]|nr:lipoprotein YedD [Kosakonia sp. H02]
MKKRVILGAMLLLSGCVQVDNYQAVVKHPAPAGLAGYWQSAGPQSSLVSPEAIASLIVTPQGDTLDCRQWQRVIAVPGKLMLDGDTFYNVTQKRDVYRLSREDNILEFDGLTLKRVDAPTVECQQALEKAGLDINGSSESRN